MKILVNLEFLTDKFVPSLFFFEKKVWRKFVDEFLSLMKFIGKPFNIRFLQLSCLSLDVFDRVIIDRFFPKNVEKI